MIRTGVSLPARVEAAGMLEGVRVHALEARDLGGPADDGIDVLPVVIGPPRSKRNAQGRLSSRVAR